ncbi:MAG: hypothetical protein AAF517_00020 [Planctomycetota bacterium]
MRILFGGLCVGCLAVTACREVPPPRDLPPRPGSGLVAVYTPDAHHPANRWYRRVYADQVDVKADVPTDRQSSVREFSRVDRAEIIALLRAIAKEDLPEQGLGWRRETARYLLLDDLLTERRRAEAVPEWKLLLKSYDEAIETVRAAGVSVLEEETLLTPAELRGIQVGKFRADHPGVDATRVWSPQKSDGSLAGIVFGRHERDGGRREVWLRIGAGETDQFRVLRFDRALWLAGWDPWVRSRLEIEAPGDARKACSECHDG